MRATWHFTEDLVRLESDGVDLLTLRSTEENGHVTQFEQRQWSVVDRGFWEPATVLLRDGQEHTRMARQLGTPHPVLTVMDGGRYSFKLLHGEAPRSSVINSMGREVMVQRAMDGSLARVDLRINRERVPRADLAALIIVAGHVFHGLFVERRAVLELVRRAPERADGTDGGQHLG